MAHTLDPSRRRFLGAAGAGFALAGVGVGVGRGASASDATATAGSGASPAVYRAPDEVTISPADPRYLYLNTRGQNHRFSGAPSSIYVPFNTDQTRQAVQAAVDAGQQIAVRSGGHCLDALVDNASVKALIDVSRLTDVSFDPAHRAFSVGSGALLGDVYKQLYPAYGVVVPGGTCPTVGFGGYVQGGGFGALCRKYGLVVDHLYGLEVVTVDGTGTACAVLATKDPADPNRDLWWAHTGSGGGNFGVVTRYLFRSPDATGTDPTKLLPSPPETVLVATVKWPWATMTAADFGRLVANHGAWHAANSVAGSSYDGLFSALILSSHAAGSFALVCQMDGTVPNAADLVNSYIAAVTAGTTAPNSVTQSSMPWLTAVYANLYGGAVTAANRSKGKGAYLRQPYSTDQVSTMYGRLSDPTYDGLGNVVLFSYGSKVNTVAPTATVVPQRDSILKVYLGSAWADPTQDDRHVGWVRTFYRDLYATTGGVPVPNAVTDGSYINYPDTDLADPAWNTSGVPWSTLYFKDNYARLQSVKARYDPGGVFRHPLSVQLP